jgi:hypothetical protein
VGDDAEGPVTHVALERVKRTRKGEFLLRLTTSEREALRGVPGMLRDLLRDGDPATDAALQRLFPPAYVDDPERSAEFAHMVHDDLLAQRMAAVDTMERTIEADRLSEDELSAWLSAINDVRLMLGVRLEVTEASTSLDFGDDDARAASYAVYAFLSWLEEDVVSALAGAR